MCSFNYGHNNTHTDTNLGTELLNTYFSSVNGNRHVKAAYRLLLIKDI